VKADLSSCPARRFKHRLLTNENQKPGSAVGYLRYIVNLLGNSHRVTQDMYTLLVLAHKAFTSLLQRIRSWVSDHNRRSLIGRASISARFFLFALFFSPLA
jgi:hypothetical protein